MEDASSMFASSCGASLLYILLHTHRNTHVHKHKGHPSPGSRPPQQPWYARKKGRRPHLANRRRLLLSVSGKPSRHRFAKFQLLRCHYSPTSRCPSRLLLLRIDLRDAVLHTKASPFGKRLLSWFDWPNSISSFCFLNIFFIFCNKINIITLFWYYVSLLIRQTAVCQVLPVAFYALRIQYFLQRNSCLLHSNCVYHLTLPFSFTGTVCRVCRILAGRQREVPHACRARCADVHDVAEINRCHKQKNKGRQTCIGGKKYWLSLPARLAVFATSSAVVKKSRESLCRCPFQKELFNRVYLQLCVLPHAAQSPLFETASVSRDLMASSQTIQKFALLNQHLGEGWGFAWCTNGSENKCFKSSQLVSSSNSSPVNCIHLPMLFVSNHFTGIKKL